MKLFLHYGAKGEILSAVKVQESSAEYHPFAHIEESDFVLKTDMNAELNALLVHEICEQYQVELGSKQLKKKATSTVVKKVAKKSRKAS
jgi:hypothetical protein